MNNKHVLQTLAAGWMAGMRTFSALVLTSNLIKHAPLFSRKTKSMKFMAKPSVSTAITGLAIFEIIGDKLPAAPARTKANSVIGRTTIGAISGAVIYHLARKNSYAGALLGGIAALTATYAMYHLRKGIKNATSAPDLPVALAEDALVVGTYLSLKKG